MGKNKSNLRKRKSKKKVLTASPPWIDLPREVTANILQRLGAIEILETAQKVCTTWRTVCQDPAMWRVIDIRQRDLDSLPAYDFDFDVNIMCRHIVDRSQGQLIDIYIEGIEEFDDETLHYICERSNHLRRLSLVSYNAISGQGLSEAVKKLQKLEELHLIIMPSILARDIEIIGISCPTLKSFTFNKRGAKFPYLAPLYDEYDAAREGPNGNGYALAIAKSMPQLRHLQLFANGMKNEGLKALLDGCPHLESLDIRQCSRILESEVSERLFQQIKDLRLPSDPVKDYAWDYEWSDYDVDSENCVDFDRDFDSGEYDDFSLPFPSKYYYDNDPLFSNDDYF